MVTKSTAGAVSQTHYRDTILLTVKLYDLFFIRQGICIKYKLADITDEPQNLNLPVAANNQKASTFGFIGKDIF